MFSWNKHPLLRVLIPFIAEIIVAFYIRFAFSVWILLLVAGAGIVSVFILLKLPYCKNILRQLRSQQRRVLSMAGQQTHWFTSIMCFLHFRKALATVKNRRRLYTEFYDWCGFNYYKTRIIWFISIQPRGR